MYLTQNEYVSTSPLPSTDTTTSRRPFPEFIVADWSLFLAKSAIWVKKADARK
mgnify:CR=1 FL=1